MKDLSDMYAPDVQAFLRRPLNPASTREVSAFEEALKSAFGVAEAVAVSTGTAAIHCALAAHHIGRGDEVLVPALSVIMSSVPILYLGASPIFVDSAPDRVDFDYHDLQRKCTGRTKAILPVHLWGCAYDMPRLLQFAEEHHLVVIEDACQAHGSLFRGRYLGTWGNSGCFSMRDGKLLSTNEGGFILTNDHDIAETCRALRTHRVNFTTPAESYQQMGYNYRLPEILASFGLKQLHLFDHILKHRRWQSIYLLNGLVDVPQLEPYHYADQEQSNVFSPVIFLRTQFATRRVAQKLAQRGVPNSVGSFGLKPAQEWGVFQPTQAMVATDAPLPFVTPNTTDFLSRVLAISLLPHFTQDDLDRIIITVKETIEEVIYERRE